MRSHRPKWSQYTLDLAHRHYRYQAIQIRQCKICDYKQYGLVHPQMHYVKRMGR